MKRGHADLPLHYGTVPPWLAERMMLLGGAITEAILTEYGRDEFLRRISDPGWFQSLGCVMGMDWHSSGITTSVMNALKKSVNPKSRELGLYICGGRGHSSRQTPEELISIAEKTGLDGDGLVRSSKLSAKVDNNAMQDGFQLYLHSFILTAEGRWAVVQQGMNKQSRMARRYHWLSSELKSFTQLPHSGVMGKNMGKILNLTAAEATAAKDGMLRLASYGPGQILREVNMILPAHHDVRKGDVNMKRLGAALTLAHNTDIRDFESLLLLEGVGPRTIQSLALVSEVIHGTPTRFTDPARFSFAHGGKDGHPFPVPTRVYDKSIEVLQTALRQAKLGYREKSQALKKLHNMTMEIEKGFTPNDFFERQLKNERDNSYRYGGKTVFGDAKKPKEPDSQLKLWEW